MNEVEKSEEYRMVKDFPDTQDPGTGVLTGEGGGEQNKKQNYNETTKT